MMKVDIKEKKENALLGRAEVDAVISFPGPTPSTQQMRDLIVQKLGCMPELLVLKNTVSHFGIKEVKIRANIYKTAEQMKKAEQNHVLVRNKLAEKKAKKPKAKKAPAAKK
jgi:ribosomal protein S24E